MEGINRRMARLLQSVQPTRWTMKNPSALDISLFALRMPSSFTTSQSQSLWAPDQGWHSKPSSPRDNWSRIFAHLSCSSVLVLSAARYSYEEQNSQVETNPVNRIVEQSLANDWICFSKFESASVLGGITDSSNFLHPSSVWVQLRSELTELSSRLSCWSQISW